MIHKIALFGLAGAGSVIAQEDSERLRRAKLELWSRGEYSFDAYSEHELEMLEHSTSWASMRLGPVKKSRREFLRQDDCIGMDCNFNSVWSKLRGGASVDQGEDLQSPGLLQKKIDELALKFGEDFKNAIKKNEEEHKRDCDVSCESFYCAPNSASLDEWDISKELNGTSFKSYSFGAVPPEDS